MKHKQIKFKCTFRNKEYTTYCEITDEVKLVAYLGTYITIKALVEKGSLKSYALKEFLTLNGRLSDNFKEQLHHIKNVSVIENKQTLSGV